MSLPFFDVRDICYMGEVKEERASKQATAVHFFMQCALGRQSTNKQP